MSRPWAVLLCASLGACGWTMAQPVDVIQVSEELPVKDRSSMSGSFVNESFKLGGYQVADVDRKWNSSSSSSWFGSDNVKTKGGYAYSLSASDAKLKGECALEDRTKSQAMGGGVEYSKSSISLACRCSGSDGAVTLKVEGGTSQAYEGEVTSADLAYKVLGIQQREKGPSSSEPLGYRVDSESAPIGAVELKRPGKVWISKAVEAPVREQVACLLTGLLLYMPPSDNFK